MCGIFGYTGTQQALPLILTGLERLQYRGYDSAGMAMLVNNGRATEIKRRRVKGKPRQLAEAMLGITLNSCTAIGHNRWATHGVPSEENAHPHLSTNGRIAVVHNGTIENHASLRKELESEGYVFTSETDTEVLPHLIERELKRNSANTLEEAVRKSLGVVNGTYGVAVISADHPKEIVVASLHSPIVIGIARGGFFVASDEAALAGVVSGIVHLTDFDIVTIHPDKPCQTSGNELHRTRKIEMVRASECPELGPHKHLMHKEIFEQPQSLNQTLAGRLDAEKGSVTLGGLVGVYVSIMKMQRVIIVACGTSYYAGLVGKLLIERYTDIRVEVNYASEFLYRDLNLGKQDTVIAISQSGETADTIRAIKHAGVHGALCLGITNRTGTKLPQHTKAGVFLQAGPECAVASTKAFTSQVVALAMMAIEFAVNRHGDRKAKATLLAKELGRVPMLVAEVLAQEKLVQEIAAKYYKAQRVMFIGRRFGFPIAMEGALKLKEVAYVDAHGFPAGELKHGPLALIEEGTPVIAIAREGELLDKMISNIEEVRARGGVIIALTTEGSHALDGIADHIIPLPAAMEELTPILVAPVLQLLAYHFGVLRGVEIDTPRNLAKSVTVE